MAKYLVTGAAGFIGARVANLLLESGHAVVGIDNLNDAYDVQMKHYRLKNLNDKAGFEFVGMDIAGRAVLDAAKSPLFPKSGAGYDAVINLAARAGVRQAVENPWVYIDTNVTGTLNMLELSRQLGIPKFILASTSSIYGANAPVPTPETVESSYPLQPYAASKKGAETLCYSYHHLYGIDTTVVRYFTVYGPAGRPDMVMFRFTQWISEGRPVRLNGDGEQSRGFTYIDDIARGTILALKPLGYEIINLGGHETITVNQLIKVLESKIGKKAQVTYLPFHPADMQTNWANISKATALLGWQPQIGLDEGITAQLDWYNAERSWTSQVNTD